MINTTLSALSSYSYLLSFSLSPHGASLTSSISATWLIEAYKCNNSCEKETSTHTRITRFRLLNKVVFLLLPNVTGVLRAVNVNVSPQHAWAHRCCAQTKLLAVAAWLLWQLLNKPLHCMPILLSFYPESPLLLARKLYCSNLCWRCRRGGVGVAVGWSSHNILLFRWVRSSNEASNVCGLTRMNWVIQWAEITPLYGEL